MFAQLPPSAGAQTGHMCVHGRRLLPAPLLALCATLAALAAAGPGSILGLTVRPPGCALDPAPFSAETLFYVLECPENAAVVTLELRSAFPLTGADGLPVPEPLALRLAEGEARLVPVSACAGGSLAGDCTTYEFDLHRRGSSQAALEELLVETGSLDASLEPEFDPSVTSYKASVQFGATVTIVAAAARNGLVSFASFDKAARHREELAISLAPSEGVRAVDIFVVSADLQGQTRYGVLIRQRPSSDAGLAAIRSNVGQVQPVGPGGWRAASEFLLQVPPGSRQVAVSATARDREGAWVRVADNSGTGYAAAAVALDAARPYALVHVDVRAADAATLAEYRLVILSRVPAAVAMLSSLRVEPCVGGLRPAFEMSKRDYRCVLEQSSPRLEVTPTSLWLPGSSGSMRLRIHGRSWPSGETWKEGLDGDGNAQLSVRVESADGSATETYTVTASGSAFTGAPTPSRPARRTSATSTTRTTSTAAVRGPTATTTSTTSTRTSMRQMRLRLPKVPAGVVAAGERALDAALVASAALALLASPTLFEGMAMLRHLQFLAMAAVFAPPATLYARLAGPLGLLNLWAPVPGASFGAPDGGPVLGMFWGGGTEAELGNSSGRRLGGDEADDAPDGEEEEEHAHDDGDDDDDPDAARTAALRATDLLLAARAAGAAALHGAALPPVLAALALGAASAAASERRCEEGVLEAVGRRGARARLLPGALVLLDAGLVGCTGLAGALLLAPPLRLEVAGRSIGQRWLQLAALAYPISFAAFGLLQVCRLRRAGRLVWSPSLRLFADPFCLAASLHGRLLHGSAGPPPHRCALSEWLGGEELESAAPLVDPAGGKLRLGTPPPGAGRAPPVTADGWLFGDAPTAGVRGDGAHLQTEAEEGLLGARALRLPEWQRFQERMALLMWMERRATQHEALKAQLVEVGQRSQGITDAVGLLVLDSHGRYLSDLYQYCVYQFPARPWLPAGRRRGAHADPLDRAGAVFASWVPPASAIGAAEREAIDVWLDRWLAESEAVAQARSALTQLRWRGPDPGAKEDYAAVLLELALAVLLGQDFQMPKDRSADEVEELEARLSELVAERCRLGHPPPWQLEARPAEPEISAALHMEVVASGRLPATTAGPQAHFGLRRFHLRTAGELPRAGAQPAQPAPGPVPAARTRATFVACELPVRHLQVLATWLPPFGFSVPHSALQLPVRRHWLPLFASCSEPGSPPAAFIVDALERALLVPAILAAWALVRAGRPTLGLASLGAWRGAALLLCLGSGLVRQRPWLFGGLALEVLLCACLAVTSRMEAERLHSELLDRLCFCGALAFVLSAGWRGAVRLAPKPFRRHPFPVLAIPPDDSAPVPAYGTFRAVDEARGGPLPVVAVVPFLGLAIRAEAVREEAASSDDRRAAGCRKRLVVYERPPRPGAGRGSLVGPRPRDLARYAADVVGSVPVVLSRAQLAGTEEVRELVCTIHVLNHAGCSWSSARHDSFLSLHMPTGLDVTWASPGATGVSSAGLARQPSVGGGASTSLRGDTERRELARQSVDSPALIKAWRAEVVDWLRGELAASGSVEHTAWDALLDAGRADRDAYHAEADRRIPPGLFSDEGVGARRFCDSRCYREGRVLHYVVLSSDLKSSLTWRPDALGAHAAELRIGEEWRPCLLRLGARGLSYSLRKRDGADCGGPYPEWKERGVDQGDVVEHSVLFFFLDRVVVDPAAGLVTLCERRGRALGDSDAAVPDYAPKCLPMDFRMDREMALIWQEIVVQYRMSSRPEHIVNYAGQVVEHPRLPGVSCREGPDGEQLWDDGTRYVGAWEGHVYHGWGQLFDAAGEVIYAGEWQHGLKHGEGTYHFQQEGTRRTYSGEWVRDEFRGFGKLCVAEECVEELSSARPYTIVKYEGHFAAADGQFAKPMDLLRLELDKHAAAIKTYFPTRPAAACAPRAGGADGAGGAGDAGAESLALQFPGEAPRDHARELYALDGADLRHCGPSQDCDVVYADGARYRGPCLAGAVPHGVGGTLVEPGGATYQGGFERGVRAGPGSIELPSGARYEGEFSQPGGKRHGVGRTTVPESHAREAGLASYCGQYVHGIMHGSGELVLADGAIYRGAFLKNRRHGRGALSAPDGGCFEGQWDDDRPAPGRATIAYPTGHRYEGEVGASCQRSGEGTLYYPQDHESKGGVLYKGKWEHDEMHGHGELNMPDGTYKGEFRNGARGGLGRFDYKHPPPGSILPTAPSAKQKSETSKARYYTGHWEFDLPHGLGTYSDEYGYKNEKARFASGRFSSDRRPPLRGCKETWWSNPRWPREDQFEPLICEPTPAGAALPRGLDLCRSKGALQAASGAVLRGLDAGSGHAHGRTRAAHLGAEGVPGTRWA